MAHEKEKKQSHQPCSNIWMIIAIILFVVCIGEAVVIIHRRIQIRTMMQGNYQSGTVMMRQGQGYRGRQRPMMVMKGQKFANSPLFAKAYQIFPTPTIQNPDAKTALTGWNVTTTPQTNGATQQELTSL